MLDLAEMSLPPELATVGDFWLIDGDRVVLMHYNTDNPNRHTRRSPNSYPRGLIQR